MSDTQDRPAKTGAPPNRRPMDQDDVAIILAASADLADAFRRYAKETARAMNNYADAMIQAADKIADQYESHVRDLLEAMAANEQRNQKGDR